MLARLQKSLKEKDQGFTLIELLVVIVIIGILAAIAIPMFLNQRKKGVDSALKSDLKSAATTIETYAINQTTTPTYTAQTVAGGTQGTGPLAEFTASSGNTVTLKGGAAGVYTLCAWSPGASEATDGGISKNLVYDPAKGGLQATLGAVAC
jgi:type IV pilus assembly protein PilA